MAAQEPVLLRSLPLEGAHMGGQPSSFGLARVVGCRAGGLQRPREARLPETRLRIQGPDALRLLRPPPNGGDKKQRYVYYHCAGEEACRKTYIREEQLDEQVRALLASIAIPDDAKAWLLQGIARSREEQRAYHQTVVQEIRTEIKEQELLMDRLYDDRLHRLIGE